MSTEREPLPYPHRFPGPTRRPYACTSPETPKNAATDMSCPGCLAYLMAQAIRTPRRNGRVGEKRVRWNLVELIRDEIDDTDPMRVLFERALRERGIA